MSRNDQRNQRVRKQYNAGRDSVGRVGKQYNVAGDYIGRIGGDNSLHVGGDYIVNQAQPRPDPSILVQRGIEQLRSGAYQTAAASLRQALDVEPTGRAAYYYLALALLQGRRPKALGGGELREVDEVLAAAIAATPQNGIFHWFRALVRDDYYDGNGMRVPPPTAAEDVSAAQAAGTDPNELTALLGALPMETNWLHSQLVTLVRTASVD